MRKIGLDLLRGLAVILVLFRHSDLDNNIIQHFGWLGVDLFFVLSGFLISNLLFTEHRKNQKIRVKRFLTRRAFKIFPPFYFFMFTTLLMNFLVKDNWNIEFQKFLSELFYLQSYFPRIWNHTWTLAVEEHFYLIFSVTLLIISRKQLLEKRHIIISALVLLLILSFVMRFYISYPHRNDDFFGFIQTHLRSDGILIGVLLSYLVNFTKLTNLFQQKKWILICISILLVTPGFYFESGGFFMNTAGLTLVNIGFSIMVLLSLDIDEYFEKSLFPYFKFPLKTLGFIGVNSYSIYLWHLNSKSISSSIFSNDSNLITPMYITISIVLGIIMSYLIEKPSLRIRDYTFNKITLYNNKHWELGSLFKFRK